MRNRKKISLGKSRIDTYVEKGDLKLEKSDVIVCATSPDLDLSRGRVSRELLQMAGHQMQLDCDENFPDGIQSDELAAVNVGNLPCQKIFFVALRPWGKGKSLQDLEAVLNTCLVAASKEGFHSIAFPALGTGLLKYPAEKVAHTTLQCVEDFSNNSNKTTLKCVNIIIFHKDDQIYSAFKKEAKIRATNNEYDDRGLLCESVSVKSSETPCKQLLGQTLSLSKNSTVSQHRYTPRYWSIDGKSYVDTYRVVVDSKTFHDVEVVVMTTWLRQFVGHGRDGVGLSNYTNIEVIRVERVQNVQLFNKYARRRQMLRRKARSGSLEVLENIAESGGQGVMTKNSTYDESVLAADIFPEANEVYLFHGTTKEKVGSIAERGLQLGSESSMFGRGIYAAESSTKADQYADPKHSRDIKDEKHMFLVRACLGRIFLATSARKFDGMPCIDGCEKQCCCDESNFCDSVVANGYWNFREFVVFDSCQVYPEYLITYKRI